MFKITSNKTNNQLIAGEICYVSGSIFTIRDLSSSMLVEHYNREKMIPFEIENSLLFFAGPTPGFDFGRGSIGPTTTFRMAPYIDFFLKMRVSGFIGKGHLPDSAEDLIIKNHALYFQAMGGVGAYYGRKIESIEPVLFPELGPEAIYKLSVKDFPLVISIDTEGLIYP